MDLYWRDGGGVLPDSGTPPAFDAQTNQKHLYQILFILCSVCNTSGYDISSHFDQHRICDQRCWGSGGGGVACLPGEKPDCGGAFQLRGGSCRGMADAIDLIKVRIFFRCGLFAKFVKKASGSRPGMVIYNNFKTIIVK